MLRIGRQEVQANKLIYSGILEEPQLRVRNTFAWDHFDIHLYPLAGIRHLLVGLWGIGVLGFGLLEHPQPAHNAKQALYFRPSVLSRSRYKTGSCCTSGWRGSRCISPRTSSGIAHYTLPCLTVPPEEKLIGLFGPRHLRYLKEYRKVTYTNLLTSGKFNAYLAEIDRTGAGLL